MISKEEKNNYQEILGKRKYTSFVLSVMKDSGVFNIKNQPYTASDIRKVMCGFEENHAIESAILVAYQKKKKELQDFENKKKKLLKNQLAS